MKNLIVILGIVVTVLLIGQSLSGFFVVDINITCPSDVEILYFYRLGCTYCDRVSPLIDSLVSNDCNITKINVMEDPTTAVSKNVTYVPTVIVGEERIVGAFSVTQLEELINN